MTRRCPLVLALVILLCSSGGLPALAGPNHGGTLVVHDTGPIGCFDGAILPPAPQRLPCSEVDNQVNVDTPAIWNVYAAFPTPSSPRLKALSWGAVFGANVYIVAGGLPDPANDFEITQDGWPDHSGCSIGQSFGNTQTGTMVECYWFAGYAYLQSAAWSTGPHVTQLSLFVDDSVPSQEDLIVAFGSLGFGQPGFTPCPDDLAGACCAGLLGFCEVMTQLECIALDGAFLLDTPCEPNPCPPLAGACCLLDGSCVLVDAQVCTGQGGVFMGLGIDCVPDPCPPVPTDRMTWGRLKLGYR